MDKEVKYIIPKDKVVTKRNWTRKERTEPFKKRFQKVSDALKENWDVEDEETTH